MAVYSTKTSSEGDALAEDVASLCKRVDRGLTTATQHLDEDGGWVEVVKELEAARGVIYGNGAGGDLCVAVLPCAVLRYATWCCTF